MQCYQERSRFAGDSALAYKGPSPVPELHGDEGVEEIKPYGCDVLHDACS